MSLFSALETVVCHLLFRSSITIHLPSASLSLSYFKFVLVLKYLGIDVLSNLGRFIFFNTSLSSL